jgi:hypothetical protein
MQVLQQYCLQAVLATSACALWFEVYGTKHKAPHVKDAGCCRLASILFYKEALRSERQLWLHRTRGERATATNDLMVTILA